MIRALAILSQLAILPLSAAAQVPIFEEDLATFSIIARDPATGEMGEVMTSKALAGGNRAYTVMGGVAVIAHQQSANPMYGRLGMEMIQMGMAPQDVLDYLLRADTNPDSRQVAMIDAQGRTAAWTSGGESAGNAGAWRGHHCGVNYCAQGNSLTGPEVVEAVWKTFEAAKGNLADRMLAAIDAGQAAGGDARGKQCALIVIVRPLSGNNPTSDRVIDFRVDDHPQPMVELRRLVDLSYSGTAINQGNQRLMANDVAGALTHFVEARDLAPTSDNAWIALANGYLRNNQRREAFAALAKAIELNPNNKPRLRTNQTFQAVHQDAEFLEDHGALTEVSLVTANRIALDRVRAHVTIPVTLLALASATVAARAQQPGALSGRVTYSVNGSAIAGALVFVEGASLGVITDDEGRYRIDDVPAGRHRVMTTLMGCVVSEHLVDVQAGRRLTLDLPLSPPVIDLEGLVVTAVGPNRDSPFAVERLEAGAESGTARSIGSLLQGKVAGIRVVQGSGQPGTDPSILLRSPTSVLIPQGPLIVIDGVITPGRLTDIDPFDVDHIEVFKGAAAAASYGSRGQGGVIEITTKRGPGRAAPPARTGPLLFVDGVASDRDFSDLPFADILDVRKLEGPVAAVLYGRRAEVGVIEVTTTQGPRPGANTIQPICLNPAR